ncbi:iron complex transport system substrate-binding protein [Saccharothrix tamanrassetensis]|uniref:Iron complex transport system substrate-binding protein n=1 Tax=Saccharothrix tamanrassetensis TaxID=1051531 RepID=A0A841CGY7_9PSEU|nr:ABC transporter substrate-binding protein [Saccharothrix tamanrassetensis]MBB5955438.1 iron complex transport system substrate-binding protein [Saccharothrix tamanrassetensis]
MRRLVALALVLSTTGCGATIAQEESAGRAVTVQNCGQQVTYDKVPSKVVTNDTGIAELMFALGLADRMAGYVIGTSQQGDVASSPWKADFAKVPKLAEEINKEVVQGAGADLVFAGWNYGFSESTGFTPEALKGMGVATYQLTEACLNGVGKQRGIMPPLEALYTDLRNLGTIFGVSEKAEELIAGYREQVAGAEELMRGKARPKVFLYDSGLDQPFTAARNAAAQDVIGKAGGDNVFGDLDDSWTTVGWEAVVARNPEVIVINDYADGDASTPEQKRAFLESYPPLREVPAVKDKRFFVLPYAALVESPRNPAAIESFARFLASG